VHSVTVDVSFEERYWYRDDGAIVWLAGFQVVDAKTGSFLARDARALTDAGLRVTGVAGAARHHDEALQSPDAQPGRPLELRRDPDNEHDPNAISVHLAVGKQLGWVPRALAEEIAPALDAGDVWSALCLRERRPSPREPRSGLTMLLARAEAVELRVHERRPPRRA
jgi:hypothetical protein